MKTILNHPNHIIYASFDKELTKIDENVIFHILKKIKHINHFEEFKKYKPEKVQLEFKKINQQRNYKPIEDTLMKLTSLSIEYLKNIPNQEKIKRTITNFISGYRKTDNKREIIIEIPSFTIEFLTYLKGGYGKLDFNLFIALKSTHSRSIYKLCAQYADKGGFKLSEHNFRKILGIENSYNHTSDIRKKINVAKKELKNKCGIEFQYKINPRQIHSFFTVKIFNINNSILLEATPYTKIKGSKDIFIYNFLNTFYPSIKSNKSQLITEQLIENGNSEQFYNRIKRLKDELSSGKSTKSKNDVTNLLISTILPEYKVKINESS